MSETKWLDDGSWICPMCGLTCQAAWRVCPACDFKLDPDEQPPLLEEEPQQ